MYQFILTGDLTNDISIEINEAVTSGKLEFSLICRWCCKNTMINPIWLTLVLPLIARHLWAWMRFAWVWQVPAVWPVEERQSQHAPSSHTGQGRCHGPCQVHHEVSTNQWACSHSQGQDTITCVSVEVSWFQFSQLFILVEAWSFVCQTILQDYVAMSYIHPRAHLKRQCAFAVFLYFCYSLNTFCLK